MLLTRWLNAVATRIPQRRTRTSARSRRGVRQSLLQTPSFLRCVGASLESLEDRALLSSIMVTGLGDTEADDGVTTLREALAAANDEVANFGADIITFDLSLTSGGAATITLGGTALTISSDLTITGPGANLLTINGNAASQIFVVSDSDFFSTPKNVLISDLTLTNGNASAQDGGAIANAENLTVANSTITGNSADNNGGGIGSSGTLTVMQSTISGNSAGYSGGGIGNGYFGTATVTLSTLSGNSAGFSGGGVGSFGTLTISHSTITRNVVGFDGGGIGLGYSNDAPVLLTNSIVAGNMVGNRASDITDFSGNRLDTDHSTNNLIGDADSSGGLVDKLDDPTHGNIVGIDGAGTLPIFDVLFPFLVDNGGLTLTHPLMPGSPALEAGGALTTLENAVTDSESETSISVVDAAPIAVGALIQIDAEILFVSAKSNNTLTVVRGQNGTTAVAHSASADIQFAFDQRGSDFPRVLNTTVDIGAVEGGAVGQPFVGVLLLSPTFVREGQDPEEGENLVFRFVRSDKGVALTATFDVSGTATLTDDYVVAGADSFTSTTGTVTFAAGSATAEVTVNPVADLVLEYDETVGVTLTSGGSYQLTTAITTTGTIGLDEINGAVVVDTLVDEDDANFEAGDLSLREALRLAQARYGSGEVEFAASLFSGGMGVISLTLGEMLITGELELVGPGADLLTIDAHGASRIFYVNGVEGEGEFGFSGLTLTGGYAEDGGAIFNDLGHVEISDSVLTGNEASHRGGAIFTRGQGFRGGEGGGPSTLIVTDTLIQNNSAVHGGGIYSDHDRVTLEEDSEVFHNTASGNGGGIYLDGNQLTIESSTVADNTARNGGGIYIISSDGRGAVLSLNPGSVVRDNRAMALPGESAKGGGIFSQAQTVYLFESTIRGNQAIGGATTDGSDAGFAWGGGIYQGVSESGYFSMNSSVISENEATGGHSTGEGSGDGYGGGGDGYGGGLYTDSYLTAFDSTFSDNLATGGNGTAPGEAEGGGIWTSGYFLLGQGTLSGNQATGGDNTDEEGAGGEGTGGGLYTTSSAEIAISTVSGNSASGGLGTTIGAGNGGGIWNSGELDLTQSTLSGNRASHAGGGLYNSGGSYSSISASTITVNVADSDDDGMGTGGGVWHRTDSVIVVVGGSEFENFGSLTPFSSIIAGNFQGTVFDEAHRHDFVHDGVLVTSLPDNFIGGDPELGPLQNNGGITETHEPLAGSPVIDPVDNHSIFNFSSDQRGRERFVGMYQDYGSVEVQQLQDYGDAPLFYGTVSFGAARHNVNSGDNSLRLGALIDLEFEGQPNAQALGDDQDLDELNFDDEDGLFHNGLPGFNSTFLVGSTVTITVNATNVDDLPAGDHAYLNAWIDLNGNGYFDDFSERINFHESVFDADLGYAVVALNEGDNVLTFTISQFSGSTPQTYARFRLSTQPNLSSTGGAPNGEVEDYVINIASYDFGDAPDSYGTLLDSNPEDGLPDPTPGAHHLRIGPSLNFSDDELNGQPNSGINPGTGDDDNPQFGFDDENGVFFGSFVQNAAAVVYVAPTASGYLNAWFDFGHDGSFDQPGDQIFNDLFVSPNNFNLLTFAVPDLGLSEGQSFVTFARFRIAANANHVNSPYGFAASGEVEDYGFIVEQPLLPDRQEGETFIFNVLPGRRRGDPALAIGYDYVITDEVGDGFGRITELKLPTLAVGDNKYSLHLPDGLGGFESAPAAILDAGVNYDLETNFDNGMGGTFTGVIGGFASIRILGIEAAAMLDVEDDLAFVFDFEISGTANVTYDIEMTGIPERVYVDNAGDLSITAGFAGDFQITTDQGVMGTLDANDIVTWFGSPGTADDETDLRFGATAFATVQSALNAVADNDYSQLTATTGTVIQIAPGTFIENLLISSGATLAGAGADATFLDGDGGNRVLHVAAGANVSISNVTIQNGAAGFGAGVWNEGTLTIVNSTLANNFATGFNGGGLNPSTGEGGGGGSAGLGGAIFNDGMLTIRNSTISGNVARGGNGGFGGLSGTGAGGGGLDGAGGVPTAGANGGGVGGTGGNSGANGGFGGGGGGGSYGGANPGAGGNGGFGGGGGGGAGLAYISDSRGFAGFGGGNGGDGGDSQGGAGGGGGAGMGGAIFNRGGTITLSNITISGNTAAGGLRGELAASAFGQPGVAGSGFGGGLFNLNGTVNVISGTFSDNVATNGGAAAGTGAGGGIFNLAHETATASGITAAAATLTLQNTIVANSVATSDVANEQRAGASTSTVIASDFNIVETVIVNTDGIVTSTGVLLVDPNLGSLTDNGGPTKTHALLPGSPAIDQGKAFGLTTDQRGTARPFDTEGIDTMSGGDSSDIGTFELTPIDYGDAPSPYPTLIANDGASHSAGGPRLGATIDFEANGQPNTDATGDGADEDGLSLVSPLLTATVNTTASVVVNVQLAVGKLDAWIDFNQDGDWLDDGEQIAASQSVVVGDNLLNFTVPAGALVGTTFARVRLSTAGGLAPTGPASDGEVEDYQVSLSSATGADVVIDLPAGSGTIEVLAEGGNLVIRRDGVVLSRTPGGAINSLTLNGTDSGNDTFVIDFSTGNPIPVGGLSVHGGMGGDDSLQLLGGSFDTLTHTFANVSDGMISLDDSFDVLQVSYTGLEPVLMNVGSVTDLVFLLPAGTNSGVEVGDDLDGVLNTSEIRGSTFEDTTFTNPTNSLTINLGDDGDTITVLEMDIGFDPAGTTPFVINGGLEADTLIVDISESLPASVAYDGGDGSDSLEVIGGSLSTLVYNATGAGAGNLRLDGSSTITFTGLEPVTITSDLETVTINIDPSDNVGGDNTATVSDAGVGDLTVTLNAPFESLTFSTPSVALIINGDSSDSDTVTWNATQSLGSLSITADAIHLNSGSISTTGNQTYDGPVTLGADTTLVGHDVAFASTVDSELPITLGTTELTSNDGDELSSALFGPFSEVGRLSVSGFGYGHSHGGFLTIAVELHDPTNDSWTTVFSSTLDNESEFDFDGFNLSFAAQTVDQLRLTSDPGQGSTFHEFGGTVFTLLSPSRNLTVNTTGLGTATFQGEVGGVTPLSSVTTNADGETRIGADITTGGGTMTFHDPVVLTADMPLTDSGSTGISFNNTVDSDGTPRDLTVVTTNVGSAIRFDDDIGSLSALDIVTVDNAGPGSIAGVLAGVGTQLVKEGVGTLILSNTNTYTGTTTINAGILSVTGFISDGTAGTDVTVNDGGTLGGTGTILGTVSVASGGTVAPGTSPGVLHTGSINFASGAILAVEINELLGSGGTDGGHDQLDVTGTVELGGATLSLSGTYTPATTDTFSIIQSTGSVTGTFSATTFLLNLQPLEATYSTMTPGSVVLSFDATPTIDAGDGDNEIEVRQESNGHIQVLIDDAIVLDTLLTNLEGLTINGQGGNDTLQVNYGYEGFFDLPITFNGGDQTGLPGDRLVLIGPQSDSFTAITHTFNSAHDGSVDIDGTLISYTGLEPIEDTLLAVNRLFTFTGGGETVTLSDDGSSNNSYSLISSTLGEVVTFFNPVGSLTINLTNGLDMLNVEGLDPQKQSGPAFSGDLTINGDGGDTVNFTTATVNLGSGNAHIGTTSGKPLAEINFNGGSLQTTGDVSLAATGEINTDGAGLDVRATNLTATAGTGITLDTRVTNLEASGGSGGVDIEDRDGLVIGIDGMNSLVGVSATGGEIVITANGSLTIDEAVVNSGGGHVTLTAAPASPVVGGSDLLNQAELDQLATWLNEGPLTLTNVFTKTAGSTSVDFHNAVDGIGRTFSVIEVLATQGNAQQIIGGYNPQSWSSIGAYNIVPNDADRTAFLFNLSTLVTQLEKLSSVDGNVGQYQTLNAANYGPTFGYGWDLYVGSDLLSGFAFQYSYGTGFDANILGIPQYSQLDYGALEVFTIANGATVVESDLTLNADVTASSGDGDITLNSSEDILQNSGNVSAVGEGMVDYHASTGTTDGVITMADGTQATAEDGNVTMTAQGHITVASISTGGKVTLTTDASGSGGIVSGTAMTDVTADLLTITAGSAGIGVDGNPLTMSVNSLAANTATGNGHQFLSEADFLTITTAGLDAGTGTIELDSGEFDLGAAGVIGDDSDVTINAPAELYLNGFSETFDALAGDGTVENGTVSAVTLTLGYNDGSGTFSGTIEDGSSPVSLTKIGSGTQTLSGTNSYTGLTTVSAGTLAVSGGSAIGDSSDVTVDTDATFDLLTSETIGALNGDGTVSDPPSTVTLTVTGGGSFSGELIDGSGKLALTVDGAGQTLTLSGVNTYTGMTTIDAGTLLVNASGSLAADSAVTVNDGGTLGGNGTINGTVNVASGGTVAPGTSPGVLDSGSVSFLAGSIFTVEIGGNSAGSGAGFHDQLNVTGSVTINGATLNLAAFDAGLGPNYVPQPNAFFIIIQNDGSLDAVTLTNPLKAGIGSDLALGTNLPEGAVISTNFLGSGLTAVITYQGGDGNDVVLEVEKGVVMTTNSLVVGADAGHEPQVRVLNANGTERFSFLAYANTFQGGVRVATGDVNGDGVADIITGAGAGAGPHVKVFSGDDGSLLQSFFAYNPQFLGGVFVASGDINGDGRDDIITGTGSGAASHVKVFSGANGAELRSFFAYGPTFLGGVHVAAGDVNGDGLADIVTGAGAGGGSHVKVFDGNSSATLRSFFAYTGFQGGVFVAAGDLNGDGRADIVTGADTGGASHVKVFDGQTATTLQSFFAFGPAFQGGVRVAVGDVDGDHDLDILAGAGGGSHVKAFDGSTLNEVSSFFAFSGGTPPGVFVAAVSPPTQRRLNLPAGGGTFEVFKDRGDVVVRRAGGAELLRTPLDGLHQLHLFGTNAGNDTLIVDLSHGSLPLDIAFNGGVGGHDSLRITGFDASSLDAYTANYSNRNDGNIQLRNGAAILSTVSFTGLEPISIDGTPTAVVFNLPNSFNSDVTLSDIGGANGVMRLAGSTFETTDFSVKALTSITINGNVGNDRVTILGLDQIHKGELIIDGGTENDILDASRSPHAVTLLGGEGNDSLIGSAFNDSLGGGIGNDNLKGGAGDDKLTGNSGNDRLDGQAGKDCFVESVTGNAKMTATRLIANNIGADVLVSVECVEIFGDSGNNLLDASLYKGSVTLHGMKGDDTLLGGSAADVLDGGEGVDQVTQSSTKTQTLTDLLLTGNGSDTLMSIERANLTAKSALGNTLDASLFHGLVTLTGGDGPDRLLSSIMGGKIIGGAGKDTIIGGDGNDIISGGQGIDWITGGKGHDAISGGDGDDRLDGQEGDDTVLGDAGHDIIQGGSGLDVCLGGAGNDHIDGGADRDTVSGGSGTNVITNAEVIDNLFTFDFNKLLV